MATANGATGLSQALAHLPGSANLALIALALGLLFLYRISLWLHPMRMCRRCGGSGHVSGWFPGSVAFCRSCDRGLVPRFGTRLLDMRARSSR